MSRKDLDNAVADARWSVATGATTTATSIAMGAGPAAATAVGASAPALMLVQKLSARWLERRQDRAARALTEAAKILDVGLDVIGERAESHDARLELLARVLEAAARTPLEEKVTALGRVLAEGLREGGSVDESIVIAAALADIEAAHVFVLHYLAVTPVPPEDLRWPDLPEPRGWEGAQLRKAVPEVAEILDGLIAVLSGHGLLRDQGGVSTYGGNIGPAVWAVTTLGRRCLLLLGEDVPGVPGGPRRG